MYRVKINKKDLYGFKYSTKEALEKTEDTYTIAGYSRAFR